MNEEYPLTFVQTDIHGCYDHLLELEYLIQDYAKDTPYKIINLGDSIDRGPFSKDVTNHLIDRQKNRPQDVFLLGNHCDMILDNQTWMVDWMDNGGDATIRSYGSTLSVAQDYFTASEWAAEHIPAEHLQFMSKLKLNHFDELRMYVHAGVHPRVPYEQSGKDIFTWVRDPFLNWPNPFPPMVAFNRYIVHGHSPCEKVDIRSNRCNLDTGGTFGKNRQFTVGVFNNSQAKPIDVIQIQGL